MKSLWSSDIQLKIFSFSTDIWFGFHTILCVYQFSILTCDGQNDDIIRLLSSQSDDWSQTSQAKDRFYQFHSDFRILFIIPRTFLSSSLKFQIAENWELENHLTTQRVCDEIKLLSARSSILSIISHGDIASFAYNANFILVEQIYSSRWKIFHVWNASNLPRSPFSNIIIAVPSSAKLCF